MTQSLNDNSGGGALPAAAATTPAHNAGLGHVLIVGAGLIGTSIGLALRQKGVEVSLHDLAPGRLALAGELGAGRAATAGDTYDVAVLAVPPSVVPSELVRIQRLNLARTFTDVASAKAEPAREAEIIGADMSTYVGGHPVAGRERSGPAAAHADLFIGRPWVISANAVARPGAIADVWLLAETCGAVPVTMSADAHDAALATVSHLPHIVASQLAAQLATTDDATVGLGGTGLQDTTRIAAGDPNLWTQILAANASHLAVALAKFSADIQATVADLERIATGDAAALDAVLATLQRGAAGRARVPIKRGLPAAGLVTVPIVVRDAPGELAAVLRALGEAGINVEDVRVEHEPGRDRGLVELDVREDVAAALVSCMQDAGWEVYS